MCELMVYWMERRLECGPPRDNLLGDSPPYLGLFQEDLRRRLR
jgi:hypothetical protein